MKNKYFQTISILIPAVLLLAGCGNKSFDTASGDTEVSQIVSDSSADNGYGSYPEEALETGAMDMAAQAPEEIETKSQASASEVPEKEPSSRKLIKTVILSMETQTFDTLKSQIEESVSSYGGYIESSNYDASHDGGQYRYYYLCARIPADNLESFVGKAGELGTITNKSENVEDVTLDYVDKTAYKDSLKTEYERVTELLEKATDLDQILALESKLSELRYEINSYESQLRTYDNQIDYSTVNISISEVEYEQEPGGTVGSRISNGFRNSLCAVRNFFINSFVFLVSNLPVLLLTAAALVLAAVIVRTVKNKFRKKASNGSHEQKDTQNPDPS